MLITPSDRARCRSPRRPTRPSRLRRGRTRLSIISSA